MHLARPRFAPFDWTWLAVVPAALLIGGFLLLPAGLGLAGTFTNYNTPGLPWQFVGLANYQAVLAAPDLQSAFGNAAWLTLLTVPAAVGIGLGLAVLLRRPFRGRGLLRTLLLAPWLVSPVAAGVMWYFLYDSQVGLSGWLAAWLGQPGGLNPLADTHWALPALALVEAWRATPLATFLLLPGVQAVPQDDLDAATLEGSPPWITLGTVILPRIRPLLLTVLLLLIGESLTIFDSVLILTGGGPGRHTVTPALYSYNQVVQGHSWSLAATAAWLLAALILLVGIAYMRLLRRGGAR